MNDKQKEIISELLNHVSPEHHDFSAGTLDEMKTLLQKQAEYFAARAG